MGKLGETNVAMEADALADASEATVLALMQALERITMALLQLNGRLTSVEEVLERSFGS
jgi:hypothetical protein